MKTKKAESSASFAGALSKRTADAIEEDIREIRRIHRRTHKKRLKYQTFF